MAKTIFKFAAGFAGIVILGVLLILAVKYWGYRNSEEYKIERDLQKLEKQYAEDPYGGDTPEETLRLFIDALKAGNTDLASKYFVLDKQEEWRNELLLIKEKGLLDEMMRDLEKRETDKIDITEARYFLVDENGLTSNLVLVKGPNGKWKIRTL